MGVLDSSNSDRPRRLIKFINDCITMRWFSSSFYNKIEIGDYFSSANYIEPKMRLVYFLCSLFNGCFTGSSRHDLGIHLFPKMWMNAELTKFYLNSSLLAKSSGLNDFGLSFLFSYYYNFCCYSAYSYLFIWIFISFILFTFLFPISIT